MITRIYKTISSPKKQIVGQEEMVSSHTRGGLGLDIRKHFLTERLAKIWNRVSREVVGSLSLDVFNVYLVQMWPLGTESLVNVWTC